MLILRKILILLFFIIISITGLLYILDTEKNNEVVHAKKIIVSDAAISSDKIALWQKEALRGDPDAQYNLAYLYENGIGVEQDEAKALELYRQAANHGHSLAHKNVQTKSRSTNKDME